MNKIQRLAHEASVFLIPDKYTYDVDRTARAQAEELVRAFWFQLPAGETLGRVGPEAEPQFFRALVSSCADRIRRVCNVQEG